jgi:hypothetical protein
VLIQNCIDVLFLKCCSIVVLSILCTSISDDSGGTIEPPFFGLSCVSSYWQQIWLGVICDMPQIIMWVGDVFHEPFHSLCVMTRMPLYVCTVILQYPTKACFKYVIVCPMLLKYYILHLFENIEQIIDYVYYPVSG